MAGLLSPPYGRLGWNRFQPSAGGRSEWLVLLRRTLSFPIPIRFISAHAFCIFRLHSCVPRRRSRRTRGRMRELAILPVAWGLSWVAASGRAELPAIQICTGCADSTRSILLAAGLEPAGATPDGYQRCPGENSGRAAHGVIRGGWPRPHQSAISVRENSAAD
jgi:hypothetical protein